MVLSILYFSIRMIFVFCNGLFVLIWGLHKFTAMTLNPVFHVMSVLCSCTLKNESTIPFILHNYILYLTAHFSVDQEAFKELIQHESDKIKNRLVEFAVYMRNIKVNFNNTWLTYELIFVQANRRQFPDILYILNYD